MLAHSPPLPLVIDKLGPSLLSEIEDHVGTIKLALRHHDRVRRIRIAVFLPYLPNLFNCMDKEFPILEHLYIDSLSYDPYGTGIVLPETFRAPNLRHLVLVNFALPAGSSLLATATGLVTLSLHFIPPSVSWSLTDLLHRVSSLPHLQTFGISLRSRVPNHVVERQALNTQNVTHVVLPNLRWLGFEGGSTDMEALLSRMTTPRLEKLQTYLSNRVIMSVTNLQQFISNSGILRFTGASLTFGLRGFALEAYPCKGSRTYALSMSLDSVIETWPLSSTASILGVLSPVFSGVMHLSVGICDFNHRIYLGLPIYNEADRTQWRDVLRAFNNVTTLRVEDGLIREISRSLNVRDGESTMDLLPELKELICGANVDADDSFDTFAAFIEARQHAGHPVTLISR